MKFSLKCHKPDVFISIRDKVMGIFAEADTGTGSVLGGRQKLSDTLNCTHYVIYKKKSFFFFLNITLALILFPYMSNQTVDCLWLLHWNLD